jgi:hypothetical protein
MAWPPVPAARKYPGDRSSVTPRKQGRRECRVPLHPRGSRAANAQRTHTSHLQVQPNTLRHSLRDGSRLIRALLGVPCSLAAVALRFVSQHLIPASGDRDHTISLVRLLHRSSATQDASTAACPNVRDGWPNAPCAEQDARDIAYFLKNGRGIFGFQVEIETALNPLAKSEFSRNPSRCGRPQSRQRCATCCTGPNEAGAISAPGRRTRGLCEWRAGAP